jgi:predicted nucleic acid-binding protein
MRAEESARQSTLADSSVLINFLGLGRLDLLISLPQRAVLIVPEVVDEIRRNRTLLDAALGSGGVRQVESMIATDLALFAKLTHRISIADASCILTAKALDADLAVDDRLCRRLAEAELPGHRLIGTEGLLLEAVLVGLISMEEGDGLLAVLPSLRYRPKVTRLAELLD